LPSTELDTRRMVRKNGRCATCCNEGRLKTLQQELMEVRHSSLYRATLMYER
jgi:hypothetical protein